MMTFNSKQQGQIDAFRKLMAPLYRDNVSYRMELVKFSGRGLRLYHLCVVKEDGGFKIKQGTITNLGSVTAPKFSDESIKYGYDFEAKSKLEEIVFFYEEDGFIVTLEGPVDLDASMLVPCLSLTFDTGFDFFAKYRDIQSEIVSQPIGDGILVLFGNRNNDFFISEWSLQNTSTASLKKYNELVEAFQRLKTQPDFKSLCGIGVYDGEKVSILDCWEGGNKLLTEMTLSERIAYLKELTNDSSKIDVVDNDVTPDAWLAPCETGQKKATFVRPNKKGFGNEFKAIVVTRESVNTVFIDKFYKGKAVGTHNGISFSMDIPFATNEFLMEDFTFIGTQGKGLLLP